MVEGKVIFGVDTDVIHVNFQPFFHYHVSEMWFMKAWNVDGALQNPKNITVGSKSPRGVMLEIDIVMSSLLFMLITYCSVVTDTNEHDWHLLDIFLLYLLG